MPTLIYEHPETVTVSLNKEITERRLETFIEWVDSVCPDVASFIYLNREGLYDNKVVSSMAVPNSQIWIPEGMKIGKALKFFSSVCDPDYLEQIRLELSRIIQENNVTGRLCLSVHPLDYLSVSENNHNWRSCHALDGEYRAGNLSYMFDKCTVVAYLKSEKEDTVLPRFPSDVPWNDKKWRCLFFFDHERKFVWAGRQYPFSSDALLNEVVNKLFIPMNFFTDEEGLFPLFWRGWEHPVIKGDNKINEEIIYLERPYVIMDGRITRLSRWIKDHPNSMAFDDLTSSSFYLPQVFNYGNLPSVLRWKKDAMVVGETVPCVHCGEDIVNHSNSVLCDKCLLDSDICMDEIIDCSHCGCRTFADLDYSFAGVFFCPECYKEHVVTCSRCAETFFVCDLDSHLDGQGGHMCSRCAHEVD